MDNKRCLTIKFGDFHFPVSHVGVECGVHGSATEAIDEIVHTRNRVLVRDIYFVQLSIVTSEPKGAVFHWQDEDRRGPIALLRIDDFVGEHLGDVFLNEFPFLWTGTV